MVTKIGGLILHLWIELFRFDTKSYILFRCGILCFYFPGCGELFLFRLFFLRHTGRYFSLLAQESFVPPAGDEKDLRG